MKCPFTHSRSHFYLLNVKTLWGKKYCLPLKPLLLHVLCSTAGMHRPPLEGPYTKYSRQPKRQKELIAPQGSTHTSAKPGTLAALQALASLSIKWIYCKINKVEALKTHSCWPLVSTHPQPWPLVWGVIQYACSCLHPCPKRSAQPAPAPGSFSASPVLNKLLTSPPAALLGHSSSSPN